ncbi:MAG: hypothetical protein ABIO40_04820 [Devosia sp.]
MADRETIIETGGGDSSGAIIGGIVVIALIVLGFLLFTGNIRFNGAPASPVTIEVPAPAPNVKVTTPVS